MRTEGYGILLSGCFIFSVLTNCSAVDNISANQSIRFGETLVSASGSFELGFFRPGDSTEWYLGIWYKITGNGTVAWVANREQPLNDTTSVLKLTEDGALVLVSHEENIIWSSNSTRSSGSLVARLLDSGNLVVKDENDNDPGNFIWQSFDYPCDTILPGMKLGVSKLKGQNWTLSSWKSDSDPASGDFSHHVDPRGYPQVITTDGSTEKSRLGPWNGVGFSGMTISNPNPIAKLSFMVTQEEAYFSFELVNSSVVTRLVLNPNGLVQRFVWINRTRGWLLYTNSQTDNCDTYALCGAYGSCNISNSPFCGCLRGFEPKSPEEWRVSDWSNGCVRSTQLECGETDGFLKYSSIKLPDTRNSWYNESLSLGECKALCSKNCSCTAYANMDVRNGGTGCFLWFTDLLDIKECFTNGQDIFIKVSASELDIVQHGGEKNRQRIILISVLVALVLVLSLCITMVILRKKQQRLNRGRISRTFQNISINESKKEDSDLELFNFPKIANATRNFSTENKIGEGGFGPVYKGVLENGQEIAVKKLARDSEQGNAEFENEVIHIARLQHRNLVKLLGYCLRGAEKMLIYEYLPHRSLDLFIFDPKRSMLLDWPKRLHIIKGIARGLLYLHQDSRLRIVHRDLKAGNILLDGEMNPKISDFGTARSFKEQESEATTIRVVGTYGYISPEYARDGLFSLKSDVFSYGVMLLEIVSGKTNRGSHHPGYHLNLAGHAWNLFREGRHMELIDASVEASSNLNEVLRAVHVGLLCVQQCPEDRPNMAGVILMLEGEGQLPPPQQPGYYTERNLLMLMEMPLEEETSSIQYKECSINMVTMTQVEGR